MDDAEREAVTGPEWGFWAWYSIHAGVSVKRLQAMGRRVAWVERCDVHPYPHWEMRRASDDDFDRRDEVPHAS